MLRVMRPRLKLAEAVEPGVRPRQIHDSDTLPITSVKPLYIPGPPMISTACSYVIPSRSRWNWARVTGGCCVSGRSPICMLRMARFSRKVTPMLLSGPSSHIQVLERVLASAASTEGDMPAGDFVLIAQPGACWAYSHATDVVGRIVEVVTGRTLGEYLRTEIFEPLGMVDTAFSVALLVYNFKWAWAWVVDGVRLPVIGRLGQRVSWLLFAGALATITARASMEVYFFVGLFTTAVQEGELLSIDCGAILKGWHSDSAVTVTPNGVGYAISAVSSSSIVQPNTFSMK